MKSSVRLFTVKGIPVGVNWTWLFVFLLVVWSLATALFPASYAGLSGSTYLVMAAVAAVLLFASVLVHELSHTLRALREGIRIREITLWLFGGVSRAEEPLPDPGAEFRVVIAGPLASAALAGAFLGLAWLAGGLGLPTGVRGVLDYLARINGLLLGFNLVPALPLDGGRIFHAYLWRRQGDRAAATISAARAGRAFGFVLVTIGLVGLLTGGDTGGLWFVFLGWFLLQAVAEEGAYARLEQVLAGLRVRDLMSRAPVAVEPDLTIAAFARAVGWSRPHPAYPVVDRGHVVGLLPVRRAGAVPRARRDAVTVADVMLTGDRLPVVHPDDLLLGSLEVLGRESGRAIVLDGAGGDELVGMLSSTDLTRALDAAPLREQPPPPRRRAGLAAWLVVGLAMAIAAGALYHPPYVVIAPGDAFDVRGDITISGVATQTPSGPYLATTVRLSQPSALGLLVAALRDDRQVLTADDVAIPGVSPSRLDRLQRQLFIDSQQMAAAAAATAVGYPAAITGTGAEVRGVVRASPAAAVLKVGDTITAVDGLPVKTASDLHALAGGRPAGQRVTLRVDRAGQTRELIVTTARLPGLAGGTGIGIVVQTRNLHIELPFTITFRARPEIGGPSAGLAYALAITDMLDSTDNARARPVAATGTIAPDGTVGTVGGVREKALAAEQAGAEMFLVPADEVPGEQRRAIQVRGVDTLAQAVRLLQAA